MIRLLRIQVVSLWLRLISKLWCAFFFLESSHLYISPSTCYCLVSLSSICSTESSTQKAIGSFHCPLSRAVSFPICCVPYKITLSPQILKKLTLESIDCMTSNSVVDVKSTLVHTEIERLLYLAFKMFFFVFYCISL